MDVRGLTITSWYTDHMQCLDAAEYLLFVFKQTLQKWSVLGQHRVRPHCQHAFRFYSEQYCMQSKCNCTYQDSLAQLQKDRQMALGQFQTAEDLFVVIAWKTMNNYENTKPRSTILYNY